MMGGGGKKIYKSKKNRRTFHQKRLKMPYNRILCNLKSLLLNFRISLMATSSDIASEILNAGEFFLAGELFDK